MPKLLLTDLTIRNLKSADRQTMYFDKNMHGFGVRVSTGGTKTFALMYGPNRRLVSIGRVGVISLADARKEAKKVLAEHTLGKVRPEAITYQVSS